MPDTHASRRARLLGGALVLALLAGCGQEQELSTGAGRTAVGPPASARYVLEPTAACLDARGAAVAPVRPRDDRLRALGDLAQRNSREVFVDGQLVGVAFVASEPDAELLADLLRVPGNPYRITIEENVVLVYQPAAAPALPTVVNCLRS